MPHHLQAPTALLALSGFALMLLLISCQGDRSVADDSVAENPYGLRPEIARQPPPERVWIEPSIHRVAVLARSTDYVLYHPVLAKIEDDRRIYVWDHGDSTYLKAFRPDGRFLQAYGLGKGQGPGQIGGALMDQGVFGDSVFAVDARHQRVHYFGKDGGYGRTEAHEERISRMKLGDDSTRHIVRSGPGSPVFLEIQPPSRPPRTFGYLLRSHPAEAAQASAMVSSMASAMASDGRLRVHEDRAVFVPAYLPVILTYSYEDTTGRAYPTPDYGNVERPEVHVIDSPGQGGVRMPSTTVHGVSLLDQDQLAVLSLTESSALPQPEDDEEEASPGRGVLLVYDVYDVETMEYLHSARLRLPQPQISTYAYYAPRQGLLTTVQDTTVTIYRVE